jgi:hypothetical protein
MVEKLYDREYRRRTDSVARPLALENEIGQVSLRPPVETADTAAMFK